MNTYRKFKQTVYAVTETVDGVGGILYHIGIVLLIITCCVVAVLELCGITEDTLHGLRAFEQGAAAIFIAEYLMTLWLMDLHEPQKNPWKARLQRIFSLDSFLDILAIVSLLVGELSHTYYILRLLKLVKLYNLWEVLHLFARSGHSEKNGK